ncbi:MAG: transketolase [Magnetococcales bacterium]|nr:transketolase [Magnetococcales bacterium]
MNETCRKIRADILSISHTSGHGHIPTCFSVVEALYAIYRVMRHRPEEPLWSERDLFVLSKGHAALGHYCTLAACGYFPIEAVAAFGAFDSRFGCHADRFKVPGVEASTGSLGHGIGVAVGMALALKIQRSDRRVFTLVGDGEANEGTVWEAVMVAVDQRLDRLTILYDHNKSQRRCLQIPNPAERFRAFGCTVSEVDGHDLQALETALTRSVDRPHVVVLDTIKGHGCQTLCEEVFAWHRRSPDSATLTRLMEELHAG